MGGSASRRLGEDTALDPTQSVALPRGAAPFDAPSAAPTYARGGANDAAAAAAALGVGDAPFSAAPGSGDYGSGASAVASGDANSSGAGVGVGGGGAGRYLLDLYERTNVVPTVFRWEHGGDKVFITGAFNGWSRRQPMYRSGNDFVYIASLPVGRHAYKFIVDDEWRFAPDQATVADAAGNVNNVIDLTTFAADHDYGTGRARADSIPGVAWGQVVPDEDEFSKEPPFLPPHLRNIALNSGAPDGSLDPMQLLPPLHVTLKHLYCTSIKDGLMVQAVTVRYRKKSVASIFYAVMPMSSSAAAAAADAGLLPLLPVATSASSAPGVSIFGASSSLPSALVSPTSRDSRDEARLTAEVRVAPSAVSASADAASNVAAGPLSSTTSSRPTLATPEPTSVPASALPLVASSAASVGVQASGAVEALAARVAAAAAAAAAASAAASGAAGGEDTLHG